MRKFITHLGILFLVLFHFGCSGVQERTAFGGGDFKLKQIQTPVNLDSVNSGEQNVGLDNTGAHQNKLEGEGLNFQDKLEQKLHKRNEKVWFESGSLPKKVQKLEAVKQYKAFLKSGKTLSNSGKSMDGNVILLTGLILGLFGYLMIAAAENGWFGLGLGGSNFNGCLVILLGLGLLIAALVLFVVGLITVLT